MSLAKDPVEKPRRCTDIFCCILFSAVVVGMFVATFIGYINGNPWKLIAPIDGAGNICGYSIVDGVDYAEYSHLYLGEIDQAAMPTSLGTLDVFNYGVCVKECPTTKTEVPECIPTTTV